MSIYHWALIIISAASSLYVAVRTIHSHLRGQAMTTTLTDITLAWRGDPQARNPWLDRKIEDWVLGHMSQWSGCLITLTPVTDMVLFTVSRDDRALIEGGIIWCNGRFSAHT